jgi:hypothetical protein
MECEYITGKCDTALKEKSTDIYQTIKGHYTSENWKSSNSNENSFDTSNSITDHQTEGQSSFRLKILNNKLNNFTMS